MGALSWLTGAGEKVTGWGEWLGIFFGGQEKFNRAENYADVADAASQALQDGFQLRDIEDIGGTAAGAYVDQKVTTWLESALSKVPFLPAFIERGIASFIGNRSQDIVEFAVDGIADMVMGEDDPSPSRNLSDILPENLRNLDLDGDGVPGVPNQQADDIVLDNVAVRATEPNRELAGTM